MSESVNAALCSKESRPQQSCPERSLLSGLLNDLITPEDATRLERHLSDCEACQKRLDELSQLDEITIPSAAALRDANRAADRNDKSAAGAEILAGLLTPCDTPASLGCLGKYEVLEVLGQGGMGIVVKALDPSLDRVVAIKILRPDLAVTESERQRFIREAKAAGSIHHPNVVTIYAVDETANPPHLVMEYVQGETLTQRLRRGRMETREVRELAKDILHGLQAAHEKQLIHRDIKPANILLDPTRGIAKISDFGIAKAVNEDNPLTVVGAVAGTPEFMSPEQAAARLPLDARSDLFSLGALLYLASSGESPFRADSTFATMRRICEEQPKPLSQVSDATPIWFASIVDRLLEKSPAERFQSTAEVLREIEQEKAPCVSTAKQSPNWAMRWTAAVVVATLALLVGGFLALGNTSWSMVSSSSGIASSSFTSSGFTLEDGRHFASLNQAVSAAASGETVTVHQSGRILFKPLSLNGKTLTIKAAEDATPTLVATSSGAQPAMLSNAMLTLEGLRIERDSQSSTDSDAALVQVEYAKLTIVDCHFQASGMCGINASGAIELRDSVFETAKGAGVMIQTKSSSQYAVEGCSFSGRTGIALVASESRTDSSLSLDNCRFETESGVQLIRSRQPASRVHLYARSNTFDVSMCVFGQTGIPSFVDGGRAAAQLKQFPWLVDDDNHYVSEVPRIQITRRRGQVAFEISGEQAWREFWQLETPHSAGESPLVQNSPATQAN